MRDRRYVKTQVESLRSRLNKMLEKSDGRVSEEMVAISQALDKLILQELRINGYSK